MFDVLKKVTETTITGAVAAGDVVTAGSISGLTTGDPMSALRKTGENLSDIANGDFE